MKKLMLALPLIAGCYSAAPAGEHRWTIKAPKTVQLENKLVFTVETHTHDGAVVQDVPYVWRVDWVGVQGTRHQGHSFIPEKITAKGTPGTATVRILAYDLNENLIDVASAQVEVTPAPQPPAR
jgi:hypothetical protein